MLAALGKVALGDLEMQARRGDIELDHVAVLNQVLAEQVPPTAASGAAHRQHHRAVGGAAHPRIGDADHVGDALLQDLGR